jgi:MinD superfamily P-loop ATPase
MEIAVISGKGGTGKSSLSAAFATLDDEVVIADCDVDAANLYLLFDPTVDEEIVYTAGHKAVVDYDKCTGCNICAEYCRFDAISVIEGSIVISETFCDGCFLCSRVCPADAIKMVPNNRSRLYSGSFRNGMMVYGRLAPGEENSGKLVNMVRDKAKQVAKETGTGIVIIDGPPGIGCPVISSITGADKIVIVTEPTISGSGDMQRAVEIAWKFGFNPYVVINKCDLNSSISGKIKLWCGENNVRVAGEIDFDPSVTEAMLQGKSVTEYNRNLDVSRKIAGIWEKISGK